MKRGRRFFLEGSLGWLHRGKPLSTSHWAWVLTWCRGKAEAIFLLWDGERFYFILFKFSSVNIIPLMLVGYKMVAQCSQLGFSALSTLEHPRAVSREGRPHKMIGAGRVILVPIRVFNLKTSTVGDFAVPFTVLRSKKKIDFISTNERNEPSKGLLYSPTRKWGAARNQHMTPPDTYVTLNCVAQEHFKTGT